MPKKIVGNAGGGNCGPLSFWVGLIKIIQEEKKTTGRSGTFDRLESMGLPVSLEEILAIDLNELSKAPAHYKHREMSELQKFARRTLAIDRKLDLGTKIRRERELLRQAEQDNRPLPVLTIVEGAMAYHHFAELVDAYARNGGNELSPNTLNQIGQYNELALSPEVRRLARNEAVSLRQKLAKARGLGEGITEERIAQLRSAHIKEALVRDVMDTNGNPNPRSVILRGIDELERPGRWFTQADLSDLAAACGVNLRVQDQASNVLSPDEERRTVTLVNQGNSHWVTVINQPELQSRIALTEQIITAAPVVKSALPSWSSGHHTVTPSNEDTAARQNKKDKAGLTQASHHDYSLLSAEVQRLIDVAVSSEPSSEKAGLYRENLTEVVQKCLDTGYSLSSVGFFSGSSRALNNKATVIDLDSATMANTNSSSDYDFAAKLQRAELDVALSTRPSFADLNSATMASTNSSSDDDSAAKSQRAELDAVSSVRPSF